jgi:nucleoside-diphosphate-sugar epimerase
VKVVVTGAAGFIGSHVSERLVELGHDVAGIDCFTDYYAREVKERNLERLRESSAFSLHELDLRTDRLDDALDGAEVVIHEAAMAGLLRSWVDVDAYQSCNFTGTHRIVEAARRRGVRRFLQASTSSVYGTDATGDERSPLNPTSPYGVTKLAAEQLVLAFVRTHDFPAVVLRYFSIYGPRQRPDMGYHLFIEAMLDGRPITVFGDGTQSRSNTYISDCVDATVAAALATGADAIGEVFNVGGGDVVSVIDVLSLLADLLGVTPSLEHVPGRPGDQRHTRADFTKAARTFGYSPTTSVQAGLAAQVEWQQGLRRRSA